MPRLNRTSKKRLGGWGPGHCAQLTFGYDFFGGGWGVMPHKIPEDVFEDMRRAWQHHGDAIKAAWRRTDKRPWGERVFELGEDPAASLPDISDVFEGRGDAI
jgi:hypothetical protein